MLRLSRSHSRCAKLRRAETDSAGNTHVSRFSFALASVRTSSEKRAGVRGAVVVLGLIGAAVTSPGHAQAPPLGTAATYGVIAGSTVTNVPGTLLSHTIINGDLGVSPGAACTGFDQVVVTGCSTLPAQYGHVTGTMHAGDGAAATARLDFFNAYNILAGL